MRHRLCFAALGLFLSSTSALASDLIASPPADLVQAYAHSRLASSTSTRALATNRSGRLAAYVVLDPVEDEAANAEMFLSTGAPASVAQGARIMLLDLRTRTSTRLCASAGNDWDPVWSPDGDRLAFYSDRDGEARLWLYDSATRACRRVSDQPAKSLVWAYEEPRWSPDGSMIYFASWPAAGRGSAAQARVRVAPNTAPDMAPGDVTVYRHEPATPRADAASSGQARGDDFDARCTSASYAAASLAVAPAAGGEARILVDAVAQSAPAASNRHFPSAYFRLSASGRWLTYFQTSCARAGDPNLGVTQLFAVSTTGGEPVLISDDLRAAVGGDEFSLTYRWSPVADELVFARDGALWRVTFGDGGPGEPQRIGEALGPLSPALHWYSEDGTMILVGINPVQRGRGNVPFDRDIDLALVPVNGDAPVQVPVDGARWAFTGVVARDDRALLQPSATSFRLLARDQQTGENVVLTIDWRTRQIGETWRGRGRFHTLQPSANGLLGIYEDFRTPADVFAYSADLRDQTRLSDVSPALRAAASGQVEIFDTTVPQHDGTLRSVRTAVLLPEGARRGDRLPAMVWFYPGSDLTQRLSQFGAPGMGDPAYLLTRRGYAVILTNVAIGPGEQRGHVIDEIMDSLMPQVHRAADLGYVDINRLAIRGQSFGGYATAAIVARTNLFRAAIPSSGVYDLSGSYGEVDYIHGVPMDRSFWSERSQPRLGQSPWEDPLRYIQNSPYYLADRIRTPILIIQGTDDFTGSRESGKLFAALRRLDRPVELALYQGGGHSPAHFPTAQAVDQMARTLDFMRRHIGEGWAPGQRPPR